MLNLPGPANNNAINPKKNNAGVSNLKISPLWTMKSATPMLMISGIVANLVNSPNTIRTAQKNSANMDRAIEVEGPIPNGSTNVDDFEAKFISF